MCIETNIPRDSESDGLQEGTWPCPPSRQRGSFLQQQGVLPVTAQMVPSSKGSCFTENYSFPRAACTHPITSLGTKVEGVKACPPHFYSGHSEGHLYFREPMAMTEASVKTVSQLNFCMGLILSQVFLPTLLPVNPLCLNLHFRAGLLRKPAKREHVLRNIFWNSSTSCSLRRHREPRQGKLQASKSYARSPTWMHLVSFLHRII